jgi:hypothetical protein
MTRKFYLALICIGIVGCFYFFIPKSSDSVVRPGFSYKQISDTSSFSLRKGDILIRPNWWWLPGSYPMYDGRKFGHVAIVTGGAEGNSIDEALAKATVVEAVFFDQATKKLQIRKKDQIRETKAIVSFGDKFKGIRYRLRMNLTDEQADLMIRFLRNQLDGGYNILSLKKQPDSNDKISVFKELKNANWHCGTLVWEAYYLYSGVDIDGNKGLFVYPSDIIASKNFNLPGSRIRF